jgi:ABC-type antimicrobial peptide transport system permease subunit
MIGALVGGVLGGALAWYHTTAGLNLATFTDQASFSYMGVAFSDRLYFDMTPTAVIQPIAVMLIVSLLCGLWPAVKAARLDPAPTLAGRT